MKLDKNKMVLELRDNTQFFLEEEKVELLMQEAEKRKFICIGGEWFNTSDLKSILYPKTVELREKKRQGYKYCDGNGTHKEVELQKGQRCGYCSHN